jgi:hypothetical protein
MDWSRSVEQLLREIHNGVKRRIEQRLGIYADALQTWLDELFRRPLPADWRQQWAHFVADQEAQGFKTAPQSCREMEVWIEAWARRRHLLPVDKTGTTAHARASNNDERSAPEEPDPHHVQPGAAIPRAIGTPEPPQGGPIAPPAAEPAPEPKKLTWEDAEEIVSKYTGVPRNVGPNRQRIPGTGKGGYRIPDLIVRGPQGSIRVRGTIVEVKASSGTKFGDLSGRSRDQIEDAVNYVRKLRDEATLEQEPAIKSLLEKAHVEVFSDLPQPKSGRFADMIEEEVLVWRSIPRVTVPGSPQTVGKPGLGAAENLALGIAISFIEAGVADTAYRDSAAMLNDLLRQIAESGDADENDWRAIEKDLKDIANMKQSWLGAAWEVISYGQGSLPEKQAIAMMTLASELGRKFGYHEEKTWGDVFSGNVGRFKKKE